MYRPLPDLIYKLRFLRMCTEVLDVVAISSPGMDLNSCWISLSSLLQLPLTWDGRWWIECFGPLEPSLSSAATVMTSRNHLTVVVVVVVVTPFQTKICCIGDLNQHAKSFHFFPSKPFNRSPLGRLWTAGTSWRVQSLYMVRLVSGSWSYLGQSKLLIFNWVGGWDVQHCVEWDLNPFYVKNQIPHPFTWIC